MYEFNFLLEKVSTYALELIYNELQRTNIVDANNCGCLLRRTYGLPCAHEIQVYRSFAASIPLTAVDTFWKTLEITTENNEEVAADLTCEPVLEELRKKFEEEPTKMGKLNMLQKMKGIYAKIFEPSSNINTRGRQKNQKPTKGKQVVPPSTETRRRSCSTYRPVPIDLNEQQKPNKGKEILQPHDDLPQEGRRHSCSTYRPVQFDLNEQIDLNEQPPTQEQRDFQCEDPFFNNLLNDWQPPPQFEYGDYFNQQQTLQEQPGHSEYYPENEYFYPHNEYYYQQHVTNEPERYTHPLLHMIPSFFQQYVVKITDVQGDGNCGFRAVAVGMGRDENEWPTVRYELLNELRSNCDHYNSFFGSDYTIVENSLNFRKSGFAPIEHWLKMPDTGLVIANTYNCIVHFLTDAGSLTFFPLWTSPRTPELNQSITIALVNGNHFVNVELQDGHPMPRTSAFKSRRMKEWKQMYNHRLLN